MSAWPMADSLFSPLAVSERGRPKKEAEFDDCSLVIIDHLHYIDFEEHSENVGVKRNVAKIRTLVNKYRVPTILISHLRKSFRGTDSIVPQIDELHGSSEISKQANHVISFGACYRIGEYEMTKPTTAFDYKSS